MIKKAIKVFKEIYIMCKTFERKLDVSHRSNTLLNLALTSSDSIVDKVIEGNKELIVSFTTYSKRIHDVHLVIESIAQQTVKPNRLVLWLDENEFSLDSIPLILHKQIARGLEIRFCPNYRSYKKLIPTLQLFPEADIITIDDDILYPHDMVEGLVKESRQYPDCIIGHRIHQLTFDDKGKVKPYNQWYQEIKDSTSSMNNMAIGVGGVLYPCGSLSQECLNIDVFSLIASNADDVWFKMMTTLNGYKSKKVADDREFGSRFLSIEASQDIALSIGNNAGGGNDHQIKSVFEKYDLYKFL